LAIIVTVQQILEGAAAMPHWNIGEFRGLLREILSDDETSIEWDAEAGEEWAFIIRESELCAALRAPTTSVAAIRFAFVGSQCSGLSFRRLLDRNKVTYVDVHDFDAEVFASSRVDLANFAYGRTLPESVLDPSCFAANDLIFVTQ
jgi:hypothetical protein